MLPLGLLILHANVYDEQWKMVIKYEILSKMLTRLNSANTIRRVARLAAEETQIQ